MTLDENSREFGAIGWVMYAMMLDDAPIPCLYESNSEERDRTFPEYQCSLGTPINGQ